MMISKWLSMGWTGMASLRHVRPVDRAASLISPCLLGSIGTNPHRVNPHSEYLEKGIQIGLERYLECIHPME
ncbi:hypothetical protein [Corticibacter populi]|uniref:hypothetical protein n=1 Tax=Corticibacter populi TaxID=1550736 RepID=UPI00102AD963|nr:hypothetical protein [Corticibacter populi]